MVILRIDGQHDVPFVATMALVNRKLNEAATIGATACRWDYADVDNFKRILQHDIGLSERSVGGPLLDLDGRCVGMNIAYANRAETFAIPTKELREVFDKLRGEGE